jgi:small conductance mechanosensitive channel
MPEFLSFLNFNLNQYIPVFIEAGTKIIVSLFALYIGLKIIKKLVTFIRETLRKKDRNLDKTLVRFLLSIAELVSKIVLILSIVQYLGVPTTSFVALLGTAGLAIGMALSGTLQNFAGGAMLLALRPFKVGDYVEVGGHSGTVESIQIFNTILLTVDNKKIILPNAECANGSMINYSSTGTRRVDFVFGIGYADDIDKAKATIQKIIDENQKIIKREETLIVVSNLGESSVDITVRVWTKSADYWDVFFEMTETVKKTFDAENISFPFPQRDVHIINEK